MHGTLYFFLCGNRLVMCLIWLRAHFWNDIVPDDRVLFTTAVSLLILSCKRKKKTPRMMKRKQTQTNQPKRNFSPACQCLSLAILAQNQNDELLSTFILEMLRFFPQKETVFSILLCRIFLSNLFVSLVAFSNMISTLKRQTFDNREGHCVFNCQF